MLVMAKYSKASLVIYKVNFVTVNYSGCDNPVVNGWELIKASVVACGQPLADLIKKMFL